MKVLFFVGCFVICPFFLSAQQIDYKGFRQWSWHKQDSTEYYLYTPDGMQPGKKYPVALFLHGCCGTSYKATWRNTIDPPVRMWHNFGENKQSLPTYIIAPATSRGWNQHIDNLKKVIDDLIKDHQADPGRLYITGFSMGAAGTIDFLQKYPDYFAAAIPMGMDFRGDLSLIKDVPIWTSKGETDGYARDLDKKVTEVRKMNGDFKDRAATHVTGVNPRLTVFKGYGHGIQWVASSTQNLTGWAYSRKNDGNKYPIVYFSSPTHRQPVTEGTEVKIDIEATDPDGSISFVGLLVNGQLVKKFESRPFAIFIPAKKGDTHVKAIAYDDKGKWSSAETIIRVDIPCTFSSTRLPAAREGELYTAKVHGQGNGAMVYRIIGNGFPPDCIRLTSDGVLKGIPAKAGKYVFRIEVQDEDKSKAVADFTITVKEKKRNEILLTNVKNYSGKEFSLTKLKKGEIPNNDRSDDEITISYPSLFEGLTLIQTDVYDETVSQPYYMEFQTDEDATVYVAYERLENQYVSTIPEWLKGFKKENGQIVAQYFYYDVYSKDFPKGKITLPDAEEKKNGVNTNYFVLVKKKSKTR